MGMDYIMVIMGHSPYSLRLAPVRKLKFYQKQTWMITLWQFNIAIENGP